MSVSQVGGTAWEPARQAASSRRVAAAMGAVWRSHARAVPAAVVYSTVTRSWAGLLSSMLKDM